MGSFFSTNPALNFFASKGSSEIAGGADFQGLILGLLDILLLVLMVVEIGLDFMIPTVHKRDKHGRDGLYTALALVEYGLLLECFRELCTPSMPRAIFETSLHLTSNAMVLVDGYDFIQSSTNHAQINSALAGFSSKTAGEAYKDGWKRFAKKLWDNKVAIASAGAIGLAVGLASSIPSIIESSKQNDELEKQLRSL
jgi:hypothetical protein